MRGWVMVNRELTEAEERRYSMEAVVYPAGVMDFLPADFLARTMWSTVLEGCIVLRYENGDEPDLSIPTHVNAGYPTYKGMQAKKVAAIPKFGGPMPEGIRITQVCKNRFCCRQDHLLWPGRYDVDD